MATTPQDTRHSDGNEAPGSTAPPGLYVPQESAAIGSTEVFALVLSALWLVGGWLGLAALPEGADGDALPALMSALVLVLPVGMIWVAALSLRAARQMLEESLRLQAAIDVLRKSYISQAQRGTVEPSITRKLEEIAATARRSEAAIAAAASQSAALPENEATAPLRPAPQADAQPSLALGTSSEDLALPPPAADFIRALNFPETAEDAEGFAALRRALKDRATAQLVQASQDVLTLMSQDGIYMDDLRPDVARIETWRAFAEGTRGQEVAALGGVRDRSSLALVHGRMKQDPIFRDAAHHFLRVFDRVFAGFAERARDADIQAFAGTRTARAFMLLARVAGTFD